MWPAEKSRAGPARVTVRDGQVAAGVVLPLEPQAVELYRIGVAERVRSETPRLAVAMLDVDVIGPALTEKVIERDREWRATDLERSVEAWAGYVFSECSECGYLDGHRPDPSFPMTTCMGCGAAMASDRTLEPEAEWIERGPVLAMVDQVESERVLATLLDEWVEEHVAEVRGQADEVEFDLSWGPDDILEEVQGGWLDGVVDDLRVVDWRVIARGIAAWLDEHPRKVDPVDHLQVAGDLLDDV